ncbi:MAG: hypothetical protein Q7R47_07065, partial [Candidatus Diapherotrites archaeon]|nr:hypothetical protein [Candidatus Diapherotrites archaeon]
SVPVHVCVDLKNGVTGTGNGGAILGPNGEIPGSKPAVACTTGTATSAVTGGQAFTDKGFGWLLLDWKSKTAGGTISATTCDLALPTANQPLMYSADNAYNRFCDAVQHTIALTQKSVQIKAEITKIQPAFDADTTAKRAVQAATGKTADADLVQFKSSAHLFRWAARQIVIIENGSYSAAGFAYTPSATGKRAFFTDDSGAIISDSRMDAVKLKELFKAVSELQLPADTVMDAKIKDAQYKNIITKMDTALSLAAVEKATNNLLVVVTANGLADGTKKALPLLGADPIYKKDAGGKDTKEIDYYVFTLDEFGYLHAQLADQLNAKNEKAPAPVPAVNVQPITLGLLQDLLGHAKFVAGLEDSLSTISVMDPKFEELVALMKISPAVTAKDS